MNKEEIAARETIALQGKALFERGLAHGTAGNISVKLDDGFLITPTNSSLGTLDPAAIAKVDTAGTLISGERPSKELFMHVKSYERRAGDRAVVHLHSTHSTAVSCMDGINPASVLPPITAYFAMRVGTVPLIPYYAPGDMKLAEAIANVSEEHRAVLLSNHGPIVGGSDINAAIAAIEELEETAKIFLLLGNNAIRALTPDQVADLHARFGKP